jgi:hypothetical protein
VGYATQDRRVIYASLTQARAEMADVAVMQKSSSTVDQFGGAVTFRYGRGAFIDLIGAWPHKVRCFTKNFCDMLVMTGMLQATVTFGVPQLTIAAPTGQLPDDRRQPVARLRQLVVGSQKTLRLLPQAWPPRVCRYYCGNHKAIREAIAETIPELDP